MNSAISDLNTLLAHMAPKLNDGTYVFATIPSTDIQSILAHLSPESIIGLFNETEGWTLITDESTAAQHQLPVLFQAAWISLTIHSDLSAVGLTAAFAQALGAENISCNVIAAAFHDHIFVPVEKAQLAMTALAALQQRAQKSI